MHARLRTSEDDNTNQQIYLFAHVQCFNLIGIEQNDKRQMKKYLASARLLFIFIYNIKILQLANVSKYFLNLRNPNNQNPLKQNIRNEHHVFYLEEYFLIY